MDIPEEAARRYPPRVDGQPVLQRETFIAGAEWARKQTFEEAEKAIADFFQDSAEMSHWAQGGRDAMDAVRALGESR